MRYAGTCLSSSLTAQIANADDCTGWVLLLTAGTLDEANQFCGAKLVSRFTKCEKYENLALLPVASPRLRFTRVREPQTKEPGGIVISAEPQPVRALRKRLAEAGSSQQRLEERSAYKDSNGV